MDSVLDVLNDLKAKKKTTYKKASILDNDENTSTPDDIVKNKNDIPDFELGSGFLFDAKKLSKVKHRLQMSDDDSSSSDSDDQQGTQLLSQTTHGISQLYGDGEDIDDVDMGDDKANISMFSSSYAKTTNVPLNFRNAPSELSILTQKISWGVAEDTKKSNFNKPTSESSTQNIESSTQNIELSTQRIESSTQEINNSSITFPSQMPSIDSVLQIPPNTIPTQNIASHSENTQTQVIKENDNDDSDNIQTQIIPSSQTQPLYTDFSMTQQLDDTSDLQSNYDTQAVMTSMTQKIHSFHKSQGHSGTINDISASYNLTSIDNDTSSQKRTEFPKTQADMTLEKTQVDSTFEKTQVDSTFPKTQLDSQQHLGLTISDVQKELEEEEKEKEKQTEYVPEKPNFNKTKVQYSKEDFIDQLDSSDSDSDLDTPTLVQEIVIKETKPKKSKPILRSYESRLKQQLKENGAVNLELGEDEESTMAQLHHSSSKAKLLEFRRKLAKKKKPVVKHHTTQKTLLNTLKKESQKQIRDHQREVLESNGLNAEDLEKESEEIVGLLEMEIRKNKKIREREKKMEKKKSNSNETLNSSDDDNEEEDNESLHSFYESDTSNESKHDDLDLIEDEPEQVVWGASPNVEGDADFDENESDKNEQDNIKLGDNEDEEFSLTRKRKNKKFISKDSDEEEELDEQLTVGEINNKELSSEEEEEIETDNQADDEEQYKERVKAHLAKQREQERDKQKRLKELKKSGATDIFELEAEESEDEWHGVGGIDGEASDEYDSEVEKMLDDYTRQDMNIDDIRTKLMAENKEMDEKMVNRILNDVKNGGFRKRSRARMDLEFSDEEDDDLRAYHNKKRDLMKKKRLEMVNDKLLKNSKNKAFFTSMVDDILETKNPFAFEKEDDKPQLKASQDTTESTTKFVLSEEFVRESLSFINKNKEDEYETVQMLAEEQHEKFDFNSLKQNSVIKTVHMLPNSQQTDLDDDDEGDIIGNSFNRKSLVETFGSKNSIDDKFKEGSKTVKVTNAYKTVGSMKASITYLGRRALKAPKKKESARKILVRNERSRLFRSGNNFADA